MITSTTLRSTAHHALPEMGFRLIARAEGRQLTVEANLRNEPAVYVVALDGKVILVGETTILRKRFAQHRSWLAQPDNSGRTDRVTRDRFLEMTGGREITFHAKVPGRFASLLTGKKYPLHRVEAAVLIDYFQPAWNCRPGGRREGTKRA